VYISMELTTSKQAIGLLQTSALTYHAVCTTVDITGNSLYHLALNELLLGRPTLSSADLGLTAILSSIFLFIC